MEYTVIVDDGSRGQALIGFLYKESLHLLRCQLLQLDMPETGNDVQVDGLPVAFIGAGEYAPPMCILKPVC
jgi:hypothetical protein